MGKMLCSLTEGAGCEVIAKVDIADGYDREWPKGTEGVIDCGSAPRRPLYASLIFTT